MRTTLKKFTLALLISLVSSPLLAAAVPTVGHVTTSNPTPVIGQSTTLSALINTGGAVTPTGTVSFLVNGSSIGNPSLSTVSTTNLLTYSQNISTATWAGYCGTPNLTANTSEMLAPDGSETASVYVGPAAASCSGSGAYGAIQTIAAGLTAGQTYTLSIWLRGANGGESVGIGLNDCSGTTVTLTTSWQRYTYTAQSISSPVASCGRGFEFTDANAGQTIYLWGAQVEAASSAGPYVATSTASASGSGGLATFSTSSLPLGTDTVEASYSGDVNDLASISNALTEIVTVTPTMTQLFSTTPSITYGGTADFSALINTGGNEPTGTVAFTSDGDAIGSGNIGSVSTTNLVPYSNQIGSYTWQGYCETSATQTEDTTAVTAPDGSQTATLYTSVGTAGCGGGNLGGIMSIPGGLVAGTVYTTSIWLRGVVGGESVYFGTDDDNETGVTLTTSWQRYSMTFPAYVTDGEENRGFQVKAGAENLSFYAWGAQTEVASAVGPYVSTSASPALGYGGMATLSTSALQGGSDSILASYSGDANDIASTSAPFIETVAKATPAITLSCSPNPVMYESDYTCTASVGDGATGTVTWTLNGTTVNTTTLSGGTTSITALASASPGTYTIGVNYSGDSNNNAVSTTATLTITDGTPTITLTCSPNSFAYGAAGTTCSGTVPDADGTVTFTNNGAAWGTVSVGSGGTFSVGGFYGATVGTYTIQATWSGDSNYTSATATTTFAVTPGPTVTTLVSSSNPIPYGGSTTLTSLVNTGGLVPTGSVAFSSNGTTVGTGTISTVTTTNVLPYSNQFGGSNWSLLQSAEGTVPVLTQDNQTDPFGGTTASTIAFPAVASGGASYIQNEPGFTPASGSIYTMSVWLRASANSTATLQVVESNGNDAQNLPVNITTTWQRFTFTSTAFDGTAPLLWQVAEFGPSAAATLYVYGAQLEQSSSVGPYVATTTASASGSGGLATLTTTSLIAGTDSLVATYSGDSNDLTSTSPAFMETVTQVTPTITWTTPAPITYGTALSSTQLDATASVPGTFVYSPAAGTVIGAGTQTLHVTFTPTDTTDYTTATATVTLTVNEAAPTITWSTPAAITYGTALSATQLDATASVPGTFTYTPAVGTLLTAGTHALSVTFTPTDTTDYTTATATVNLTVSQATPTLKWSTPTAITYGTALSATQLDATSSWTVSGSSASVPGAFTYTPAVGTLLTAGTHALSVTFTPTDTTDYTTATATVNLAVNKATPTVTWSTPAAISYGTALSAAQLDATSSWTVSGSSVSVPGTFAYTPVAGSVLTAGTHALSVTFTPTDTTDYNTATATVNQTVNQATPTITWAAPAAITYGTTLSATQLDATASWTVSGSSVSVPGTFVYSPAAGTVLGAGAQTLNATFTPTDTTDYTTATAMTTLTVNKAMPTTKLTSTYNPSTYGATVTLTSTVTSGATGTVTFMDGATALATVTLNGSSVASYTTATLAAGTHNITANYSGDSNYQ